MSDPRSGTVSADGVDLYYEVRGEGVPVLLIQGGIGEAGTTDQLAEILAADHQVITYDRRGLSRSHATADRAVTMELLADDAGRVLDAATSEPAFVIGTSVGALTALHLAHRHSSNVIGVIAHEPPMSNVVDEPAHEAELDAVEEIAKTDQRSAIRHLASLAGPEAAPEPDARPGAFFGNPADNLRWFFDNDFPAVRASSLGADELADVRHLIHLAVGEHYPPRWERRCAIQLSAELRGNPVVELPGGHVSLITHPRGSAEILSRTLRDAAR